MFNFDNNISATHHQPLCFCTQYDKNDPDLPNYRDAMSGDYPSSFKKAMDDEIDGLVKRNTWTLVP